jgi:hypothetical protein
VGEDITGTLSFFSSCTDIGTSFLEGMSETFCCNLNASEGGVLLERNFVLDITCEVLVSVPLLFVGTLHRVASTPKMFDKDIFRI